MLRTIQQPKRRASLAEDGVIVRIQFSYDPTIIQEIKQLDGKKWVPAWKRWEVPISTEVVERLKELDFTLTEDILKWGDNVSTPIVEQKIDWGVLQMKKELYPFQREGVAFIEAKKGRVLIADEMGLGKSLQAITYLQLHPELRPAIIICPSSLKLNWLKEWRDSTGDTCPEVLSGRTPYKTSGDVLIINYDILSGWVDHLKTIHPKIIIFDEAHYTKERSAKRTQAAKELCKNVPHVIALTGTPVVNRPIEMFNTLQILEPTRWSSFWKFAKKYCGAYQSRWGWVYNGSSNTNELHQLLTQTVMIRRRKAEVLKQLPAKTRTVIPLEITNRKEYDMAEDDFLSWLSGKDKEKAIRAAYAEAMVKMEMLKQLTAHGKMEQCIDWVNDMIESGQKLVLFCTHRVVVDTLMNKFKDIAVKVDGSVTGEDRAKAVEKFQTDSSCMLFIGNIKAAGVGITLTAASNVAFLEYPWSPGDLVQAEDRIHRIGQEAESVNVWYLIAVNTIEDSIIKLLDKKRKVIDSVVDGGLVDESSLIGELLQMVHHKEDRNDRTPTTIM